MPTGSEASWAITLPNTFEPYGNIAQKGMEMKNQQNQMLYSQMLRQKAKDEEDQWKKLNLIQDLTDLSKHQTGSDVANTLGNQQMSKIYQEMTANAAKMSPIQLQAEIQKKMSGIVNSMEGIKSELEVGDEYVKQLKTAYPNLDIGKIAKDIRADVVGRRMKNDSEFVPNLEVQPTALNLQDPDVLSKYVTGNKNIINSITDPKGADQETVLMGKQGDYTKFEGKVAFWKKPNYDRQKFNSEGFYTGKDIPTLNVKSETIPSSALPSSNGKPFEVATKEDYERFAQDGQANLELTSATRQAYPEYDNFNSTEKEYAKRNILLQHFRSYDQTQLHPTQNVRPQVTHNSTRVYNNSSKEPTPIDLREYKDVPGGKDITDLMRGVKVTGLPNGSSLLAESVVYDPATQRVTYKEYTDGKETAPKTVSLTKFKQDIKTLNPALDMKFLEGLNKPITGTVTVPQNPQPAKKEIKRSDIASKAKAAGYSEKEYEALLKKNGITIKD